MVKKAPRRTAEHTLEATLALVALQGTTSARHKQKT